MYSKPATLLFKFNGFDQPAHHKLYPDEISDATTSFDGWRGTSPLTDDSGRLLPDAEDGWGGAWGITLEIDEDEFYSFNDGRVVNSPQRHSHYTLRVTKREANNSAFSRSLGNKICSRARIIVRDTRSGSIYGETTITSFIGSFSDWKWTSMKYGVDNVLVIWRDDDLLMPVLESDNALIIELEVTHDHIEQEFNVPRNTLAKAALKMLSSGEDADVSFIIGNTVIHAHKLILKLNAGLLHTFVDKSDTSSPVKERPHLHLRRR